MEVFIGGFEFKFRTVNSKNPYAKEIAKGVRDAYANIAQYIKPKLLQHMNDNQHNDYLLFLFLYIEKDFSIDKAKEQLKDYLFNLMKNTSSKKEINARNKIIQNRLENFDNDDIVESVTNEVEKRIKEACKKYEEKMQNAINESLF